MSNQTPKYNFWEAIRAALAVGMTALQEVRTLARQPGPKGNDGLGFDDMDLVDTERGVFLRFQRGEENKSFRIPLLVDRGDWKEGTYRRGDAVTDDGSLWIATAETDQKPGGEGWRLAVRGGRDGRSFNIRGTYVETGAYKHLDVVTLNGASFAARRDNPGICPGDGWQLIAAQGKRGQVEKVKGEPGKPGASVQRMDVDGNGLLTLTNGDGTQVRCDLYPLLAKLG